MSNAELIKEKLKAYTYYIVIFILSFLTVTFAPMISLEGGISLNLPESAAEWIVFIFTRIFVSLLNVLIFVSFNNQGKINVKDNDKFKEANEILQKTKVKEYIPESPRQWLTKTYLTKGISIFLSSCMTMFAVSQAIVEYDYKLLLSYGITLITAIVFGLMQMIKSEEFWTTTYYDYAKMKQRDYQELKEKIEQERLEALKQTENESEELEHVD